MGRQCSRHRDSISLWQFLPARTHRQSQMVFFLQTRPGMISAPPQTGMFQRILAAHNIFCKSICMFRPCPHIQRRALVKVDNYADSIHSKYASTLILCLSIFCIVSQTLHSQTNVSDSQARAANTSTRREKDTTCDSKAIQQQRRAKHTQNRI